MISMSGYEEARADIEDEIYTSYHHHRNNKKVTISQFDGELLVFRAQMSLLRLFFFVSSIVYC